MLSWKNPLHHKAGGAEEYTYAILKGLRERGHIITWYAATDVDNPASLDGINLAYGGRGMSVYYTGYQFLRKFESHYDVVIDQLNTFGFMSPKVTKRSIALIHQLADDVWDYEVRWPINVIGKSIERQLLNLYKDTPFITVSQSTLNDLRELGWDGKGHIVTNGVKEVFRGEKSYTPTMCFLGRVSAQAKRLKHAIEAFQIVRHQIPSAKLLVIGRGEPPRHLNLNTPGIIRYQNVSDEVRNRLLSESWVCIATSVREGWGRMVSEAGAAGTATVAYDVPGLRDSVVHGLSGYLVSPNPSSAASEIIKILRDRSEAERLGENARSVASRYSWTSSIELFERILLDTSEDTTEVENADKAQLL